MDLLSPPLPVPRPAPGRPLGLEKCPCKGLLGGFPQCPEFWGTRSLRQHLAGSIATPPQSLALLHGVLNSMPSLAFPQCPPACQRTWSQSVRDVLGGGTKPLRAATRSHPEKSLIKHLSAPRFPVPCRSNCTLSLHIPINPALCISHY